MSEHSGLRYMEAPTRCFDGAKGESERECERAQEGKRFLPLFPSFFGCVWKNPFRFLPSEIYFSLKTMWRHRERHASSACGSLIAYSNAAFLGPWFTWR